MSSCQRASTSFLTFRAALVHCSFPTTHTTQHPHQKEMRIVSTAHGLNEVKKFRGEESHDLVLVVNRVCRDCSMKQKTKSSGEQLRVGECVTDREAKSLHWSKTR